VLAVRAGRAPLEDALAEAARQDASLFAPLHPSDYRTLDDRIAARELEQSTSSASSPAASRELRVLDGRRAVLRALRVDETQPGLARSASGS